MERILFDELDDFLDEEPSGYNEYVQVSDTKADYISNKLAEEILDEEIDDCLNSRLDFSGLSDPVINRYIQTISDNASPGRKKKDFFLPFPTSTRHSERNFINHFGLAPQEYWFIASSLQSSEYEVSISKLEEAGLWITHSEHKRIGSYPLSELKHEYESVAEHLIADDEISGDIRFLFDKSSSGSILAEHEDNCIDIYKPICQAIANTRLHNYTLYLRRLAENVMHSSRKVSKNMVQLSFLGDERILCLQNHSNLKNVESGPLCSFIIKMTKEDYNVYSQSFKLKILFSTETSDLYVFVPWRSFDLIDCTIMLRSHYNLMTFPLLFLDGLSKDVDFKLPKILKLLTGLIQCRNTETFQVLSCFRYIMPGILNKFHNISELIMDKFPHSIRSGFSDYIVHNLLLWLSTYKDTLVIQDRSSKSGNIKVMDEYDVEFKCRLPYLDFDAENFDQYLTMTYLVSMTVGKTKHSRHVYLDLYRTLREWQDKADAAEGDSEDETYYFSEFYVDKSAELLSECTNLPTIDTSTLITKFLRTKGTLDDLNDNHRRLYDRTLYELDHPIHECTINSLLKKYKPKPEMRMAVRDDHAGEREIFVTSLPAVCALNSIEGVAHSICEQLPSEHITLGGEKKVLVMQNEAQSSLASEEKGWINYLGSEDASKWSTGDNPDILSMIWSKISTKVPDDYNSILTEYLSSISDRKVIFQEGVADYINLRTEHKEIRLTKGWPQGFFNKISSLKHYLCYCLAIAMFKKSYTQKNLVRIKFAVHSDDSRHRLSFDPGKRSKKAMDLQYEIFIKCLYWAKRKFLIRPNIKKSFYGGAVSEYLSNFQFHGSLFVPKSKFILNIFGDLTGSGYPSDVYSVMERIRTCMRMNIGLSMGKYMMNYASYYVRRLYSMLPDMRNYDPLRNVKTNLIELGGVFSCHPIYLLFLGCKAHDILHYSENRDKISKMISSRYLLEDIDENSPSEIYNHFLPIPTAHIPEKGSIRYVRRKYKFSRLSDQDRWMALYLEDLDLENATKVAKALLFSPSMAKAYSTAPEGLMYARIQQTWDRPSYTFGDQQLTYWEYVRKVESLDFEPVDILSDLTRSSPTLLGLIKLEGIKDAYFGRTSRVHVSSSQINRINLLSPGGNEYRYMKYALANLLNLDITIPERVDQNRLRLETDVLEKDISRIPGVKENMSNENVPLIFKLLNLRNAKPTYLHLNKHIVDPSRIDLYELISSILKQYTSSVTGKVSLGKLSSIHVGQRTFRPQDITYKSDRDDEMHTLAKVLSLAKSSLDEDKYNNFKSEVEVNSKPASILMMSHPVRSSSVSYYIDYLFVCKEYNLAVDFETDITEQDHYENPDELSLIIRSGKNVIFVQEKEIQINDPIDNNTSFPKLLALAYLRMYQLRLSAANDWSLPEMPKELLSICPHLYFKFKGLYSNVPRLAYHEGKIVYKNAYFNKYFDDLSIKRLSKDIMESDGEVYDLRYNFEPNIEFTDLIVKFPLEPDIIKRKLGIGVSWESMNTCSVGELAKFKVPVKGPDFQLLGKSSQFLFDCRYFATDDMMLLKNGIIVPDVSRHKRYCPHLNISDLKKKDFEDLRLACMFLMKPTGAGEDKLKKSLYYSENVEPERSIYSFFSRSQIHASEFKSLISYNAYNILCQNLLPIRCRINHETTLRKIKHLIQSNFGKDLTSLRPSKYNMVSLVLHTAAMIGLSQEINEPELGNLSGDEYIEFVKYAAYAGCTANVWSKIFETYMKEDEMLSDDLED
jgi:hypothetical protein